MIRTSHDPGIKPLSKTHKSFPELDQVPYLYSLVAFDILIRLIGLSAESADPQNNQEHFRRCFGSL